MRKERRSWTMIRESRRRASAAPLALMQPCPRSRRDRWYRAARSGPSPASASQVSFLGECRRAWPVADSHSEAGSDHHVILRPSSKRAWQEALIHRPWPRTGQHLRCSKGSNRPRALSGTSAGRQLWDRTSAGDLDEVPQARWDVHILGTKYSAQSITLCGRVPVGREEGPLDRDNRRGKIFACLILHVVPSAGRVATS